MKVFLSCVTAMIFSLMFVTSLSAQSLEDNADYREFRKWVVANQQPGQPVAVVYDWCAEAYKKMIAGGVSPSTRVIEDSSWGDFWKGTVQEINEKYCEGAKKKLTGDLEAKHKPYKALLKADKLRLVINEKSGHVYEYALAGGKYTSDPKALAAAKVWFLDIGAATNETRICRNGGKLSSVRRYSFDANHKLLGTTEKEYCGTPPASAYK
jgi:hypothetical protein